MYFIYDADDNIIGNPKGYRTHKGAQTQANNRLQMRIWATLRQRQTRFRDATRLYSIRYVEVK